MRFLYVVIVRLIVIIQDFHKFLIAWNRRFMTYVIHQYGILSIEVVNVVMRLIDQKYVGLCVGQHIEATQHENDIKGKL